MSAALGVQNVSVPSENWDDDFDFLSQSGSPKRHKNAHEPSDTARMSTATEDWDVDNVTSSTSIMNHEPPRPSNVLADKLNITAANLADWAENDPTTPQKASFATAVISAESWDDDFLDKTDSARPSPRAKNNLSRQSVGGKLRAGVTAHRRKPARPNDEEEHESWDDEFDFSQSPAKQSKLSTPEKSQRTPVRHTERIASLVPPEGHPNDLSDDDDDINFGVASAEEDRTVTARSRRAPQQHTPPPPVPSVPFTLVPLSQQPSTSSNTHLSASFPRSPTTSVFSVPTPSVADTNSLRSTAPLRPSISRTSANNALKYLPPSPPIHRERRRLRKKSRPQPHGMIELADLNHDYPFSDTDADYRLEEVDERRTPSPPPVALDPISPNVLPIPPQVSGTGGALLSRIGSVKRWTTRKKRGSTTPSEVTKEEKGKDTINSDGQPTPRPRASLSSLLHTSQPVPPPPPSSSWFFRPSSPVYTRGRNSIGKNSNPRSSFTGSRSGSMTDLSMRGSIYASSSNYDEDESTAQKNPNKLVKRKSLGFVQLSKGLGSNGQTPVPVENGKMRERMPDGELSVDMQKPTSKRPMSMQGPRLPSTARQAATQRHASYGTPKSKELSASTNDLHEITRDRKRSTSRGVRPKSRYSPQEDTKRPKEDETEEADREERGEEEEGKGKEEGSRGFMGSIRRLSMVGRHRRNKSGASLKNMDVLTPVLAESSNTPPALEADPTLEDPPSLPPLPSLSELRISRPNTPRTPKPTPTLLPPIELQPPSPPRDTVAETPELISRVLNASTEVLLSPPPSASPLPPTTASSNSRASPSCPLSPISKPPESRSPVTPKTPKSPSSPPQTASLGRSTISPKHSIMNADLVQRRNSLNDLKSDLKIPARISQAQQGLKRDLGMVRDFALLVEQLRRQQEIYRDLTFQIQRKLDAQTQLAQEPAPRAVSPSFFNLAKPRTRARSNTNPGNGPDARHKDLAATFHTINLKYHISWECAELLVDLADGTSTVTSPPPNPLLPAGPNIGEKRGRERAITLAGDESKPPTPTHGMSSSMVVSSTSARHPGPPPASPIAWRASTGRHDLSHRQLLLLREMLNNAEAVLSTDGHNFPVTVPEESTSSLSDSLRVNRDWQWDNPMSSTVTLPSEEQAGEPSSKGRRMSKLMGMTGLRDMLRALKRSYSENVTNKDQTLPPLPAEQYRAMISTASLSTDTSYDRSSASRLQQPATNPQQRRRAKTSAGPETVTNSGKERGRDREPRELSLSSHGIQLFTKSSPRRPSLASIFRLGSRKNTPPSTSVTDLSSHDSDGNHAGASRPMMGLALNKQDNAESPLEEDWDRIDSAADLYVVTKAPGTKPVGGADGRDGGSTVRLRKGKSPYLQYQVPSSSQHSRPTTPRRSASGSQLSLWAESPSKSKAHAHHQAATRAPRLSNVDEGVEATRQREQDLGGRPSSRASSGRIHKSESLRSSPPQPIFTESRLAMTPDNIRPLLENAKEVYARLGDCIMEIRQLLEEDRPGERSISGSSCASASGQSSVS